MNDLCFEETSISNCARTVKVCEVKTLSHYVDVINAVYGDKEQRRFFFRGHYDLDWKLLPAVFRNMPRQGIPYDEHGLTLDYKQCLPRIGGQYDALRECDLMLAEMQHYGVPTRLLDWTIDPLLALFFSVYDDDAVEYKPFACGRGNVRRYAKSEPDGCVWIHNPWEWNKRFVVGKSLDAQCLARSLLSMKNDLDDIRGFVCSVHHCEVSDLERLESPIDVVNRFSNERKFSQSGCFTVFGLEHTDLRHIPFFCHNAFMIKIPFAAKSSLLRELERMNVNAFRAYPDKGGFAKEIKLTGSIFRIR